MKVHDVVPFSLEKNLGRAYNEAMNLIPDGDFACLRDGDTMFLTPDYGEILHHYAMSEPLHCGVMTCFTNRLSELSRLQLRNGLVDEESNMKVHIAHAEHQKKKLYQSTIIQRDISGFLMLVSKDVWKRIPFAEDGQCIGVDTYWSRRIREAGLYIYRMDGLYVWHTYRLKNGILDKSHLL